MDPDHQLVLQVLNCVSYAGGCFSAYASQVLISPSLSEVTAEMDSRIVPAGWAFIIWGPIYALIAMFTIYQALPDRCCPNRNNDAIFNKINYWFSINMLLNAAWCPIF